MECATADLVALTEINRSVILFVLDEIAKFFRLTAVRIIVGIVIAAFLLYLILSFIAGRNRRNRKKRRAQKRRKQRQNQNRR